MLRLWGSLVVVCVWAGVGLAQEPRAGKQQRADELFEEGRKLLADAGEDKARVKVACEKFDEAIKLDPEAPGTMLNLGLCNEKLDKYKTALYWFRKAQARASESNLPAYEKAAKDHTADLAMKVATIKITFSEPPPQGTKVKIDGEEIAPADYLRAEVDPGDHQLVAGAPGKKIVNMDFNVEGRGGQTLNIQFVTGENTILKDPGARRRRLAIYLAIGGGTMWMIAGGVSLWAKVQYDKYAKDGDPIAGVMEDRCSEGGCTLEESIAAGNHYQQIARWGATPIFVVGSLAIGGAIYMYVTAPERERIDQTVRVTPVVGPNDIGFAVSGGF
jgi:hypothetical protein